MKVFGKNKEKEKDSKDKKENPEEIKNPDEQNPESESDSPEVPAQENPEESGQEETSGDDSQKFYIRGHRKFYKKESKLTDDVKQIVNEAGDKMVYSDTGIECSYYLDLTPAEEKRFREKGMIF